MCWFSPEHLVSLECPAAHGAPPTVTAHRAVTNVKQEPGVGLVPGTPPTPRFGDLLLQEASPEYAGSSASPCAPCSSGCRGSTPPPTSWSRPASPGQGAQRSASGLPTAAEWFSKRTARTECLQRQSGEPGPRAFQDTLSPGWVTSARLGVSGVQHERLVHVVGQVPPGSWLTACDGRLSPELAWESSSTVEGSQRQHYEHLQAHSLKSAVTR